MASETITTNNGNYLNYNDYQAGNYEVENGSWGAGGSDGTSSSITLNPATFPADVTFNWNWPLSDTSQWNPKAYPNIIYVHQWASGNGGGTGSQYSNEVPTTVANFTSLTATYSVSLTGDTNDASVAFDIWLTNPNTPNPNWTTTFPQTELMVFVHSPTAWGTPGGGNQPYTITVQGLTNAGVNITTDSHGTSTSFVGIASPQDALSGTISIGDIFKTLLWNGVISPNETVSDIRFGSEVGAGQGSMTLNNFSVNWQANPNVTVDSSNTLTITTMGGNHILGNGAADTVVYSGAYASYQLEQLGADTLITQNNNISTLDDLNAVSFIKFADGTFDVTHHTFTPLVGVVQAPAH